MKMYQKYMKKIFQKRKINKPYFYKKYTDINKVIEKRYNVLIGVITVIISVLFINLFYVQIIKNKEYKEKLVKATETIVSGSTAPRGRIYDRNHKLIVDNETNKVIVYKKKNNIKSLEEVALAYKVALLIDIDLSKLTDNMLRNFYVASNPELARESIEKEEWKKLEERKLTLADIEALKKERVNDEVLNNYSDVDRKAAYIYYLMNKGYSYTEKIIKNEDVTDTEFANIASNMDELSGFDVRLDWNRTYPYGNTFKTILGNISTNKTGIPAELKDYYLKKGYNLDDRVGISYLEYMYDDYLKGTKDVYKISNNGSKTLITEGKRGNDIVLTIDIELQQTVEKILEEELIKAKSEANTEYYNRSFVIITNPKTGEVLAMAGKQIINTQNGYEFLDYTPGIITAPVVVGSAIKGASHIVGYNTGALSIGEKRYDNCVKLKGAPEKCSWKYLGLLDDITALKQSSNTYQFYTALKVASVNYSYNMPFKASEDAFNIYRDTFKQFGLGVKTEIDLPNEIAGYQGTKTDGGLLLDFAIGQYDNYTPMQLSQYISTIANGGYRIKPYLLKEVYSSSDAKFTNKIYENKVTILNQVNTKSEYLDRVKLGFIEVLKSGGTGSGYINKSYKPAGKTGTSQSFIDTDFDGIIDTPTVSNTFVGYAPYDDAKVTFTVVSPDTYNYGSDYQTYVNMRISKRVSDKYFELYP